MTKYIPHTPFLQQIAFLLLNCKDAFYGGSVGGGKSDALLMAALQYVDVPGYNALLLRDSYANLIKPEGLRYRADEWLAGTDAKWDGDMKAYIFPSSATLSFGYLDGPRDHFQYQGPAYQFIGIDEMVGVREHQALSLFTRMRKRKAKSYLDDLKKMPKFKHFSLEELEIYYKLYQSIPIRFRGASNPPIRDQLERGLWVKGRYVDPKTREDGTIFIPSKLNDNPHVDKKDYIETMKVGLKTDPITLRQLLDGDWEIQAKGNMFDRSWFELVDASPAQANRVRYWDMAATEAKKGKEPAYTCGVLLAEWNGVYYIEDVVRFRKEPSRVEKYIRQVADLDGTEITIWQEQEPGSSGKIVIDHYRRNVLPEFSFKEDKVSGNKSERAAPFATQCEAGNVKIIKAKWNVEFLKEAELFPNSQFKDQIDAVSGAWSKLAVNRGGIRVRCI